MVRVFRHYISGIYLVLFFLEWGVFSSAFFAGNLLRFHPLTNLAIRPEALMVPSAIFAVVMLVSSTGMGLYQRTQNISDAALLLRVLAGFIFGASIMSLVFYAFPSAFVGRGVFGFALVFSLSGVLLCRFLFLKFVDQQSLKVRVLVLGAGYRAHMIQAFEQRNTNPRFNVIGFVPMGDEPVRVDAERLIRPAQSLINEVTKQDVDEIVVAPDDRRGGLAVDEILDCKMSGFEVIDLLTFFEREAGLLRVDCLHPSWLVFSDGFRLSGARDIFKRMFDILASLALLMVAWPFMILTTLAIFLESGFGPPYFIGKYELG